MLATRIIGCYEKELSDSLRKWPEGCLAEKNWGKECMLVTKQGGLGLGWVKNGQCGWEQEWGEWVVKDRGQDRLDRAVQVMESIWILLETENWGRVLGKWITLFSLYI